jgi:hypothetical protein
MQNADYEQSWKPGGPYQKSWIFKTYAYSLTYSFTNYRHAVVLFHVCIKNA